MSIVRTDGFGVAVDHDRFDTDFPQGKRRMHTAVVKTRCPARFGWGPPPRIMIFAFDPVGLALAFILVRRIQIRRGRFKLGTAGVNHFIVHAATPLLLCDGRDILFLQRPKQLGNILITESVFLDLPRQLSPSSLDSVRFLDLLFKLNNIADVIQKPRIDLRELENLFDRENLRRNASAHIPQLVPAIRSEACL